MRIDFNIPFVAGNESQYVAAVLAGRQHAGNGPFTKRCQDFLRERYSVPHVLLTTACTSALELMALALDCGPDDEVIVPSYTFSSTASAFLRTGARLVFADVDPETMMIDADDVARRITPRTKAVCPIHYAGVPADMAGLGAVCQAAGVVLVEDAAQGLDVALDGKWMGTFGPMATFSFHETKNLHCGLGGALFINDPTLFERIEYMWERGTNRANLFRGLVDKYSWVELGGSFYPNELSAAFLLAQLEAIDRNREERLTLWTRYRERLGELAEHGHFTLQRVPDGLRHNGHAFYIMNTSAERGDALAKHLESREIAAYIGYVPLHSSQMGQRLGWRPQDLPLTEAHAPRVLRMPLHNHLSLSDVDRVCDEVEAFFERAPR